MAYLFLSDSFGKVSKANFNLYLLSERFHLKSNNYFYRAKKDNADGINALKNSLSGQIGQKVAKKDHTASLKTKLDRACTPKACFFWTCDVLVSVSKVLTII